MKEIMYNNDMEKTLRITLLIKMIIGFTIAYLLGLAFSLEYSYTAGVITVLSLALTKEAVIVQALKRFGASLIGIGLGALIFFLLGYEIYSLVIVVIVLLSVLYLLKLEIGIVLALVLISQEYLGGNVSYSLNALFILLVGVGVAIILNLYSPTPKKIIYRNELKIDRQISDVFSSLSKQEIIDFTSLKSSILNAKHDLVLAKENRSFADVEKRISYIGMRENQTLVLERISHILANLNNTLHKQKICDYLGEFVNNIGRIDYATGLLAKLDDLHDYFELLPLPISRKEFEQRAELFHVLGEVRAFLEAKIDYHIKYDI